jgi:hypothetical protein
MMEGTIREIVEEAFTLGTQSRDEEVFRLNAMYKRAHQGWVENAKKLCDVLGKIDDEIKLVDVQGKAILDKDQRRLILFHLNRLKQSINNHSHARGKT